MGKREEISLDLAKNLSENMQVIRLLSSKRKEGKNLTLSSLISCLLASNLKPWLRAAN